VKATTLLFRIHAVQRMFERDVSVQKVRSAVESGETIEDYSAEMPEPGRLILGFQGKRPFHVVASESQATREITVITVYVPDPRKWDKKFTSRRS
jgi:hypothetical protein